MQQQQGCGGQVVSDAPLAMDEEFFKASPETPSHKRDRRACTQARRQRPFSPRWDSGVSRPEYEKTP
jgi:hypothetical protein